MFIQIGIIEVLLTRPTKPQGVIQQECVTEMIPSISFIVTQGHLADSPLGHIFSKEFLEQPNLSNII